MTTKEEVSQVVAKYCEGARKADRAALEELCTEKMLKQFGLAYRSPMMAARLLLPQLPNRLRNLTPESIEVESCTDSKVVVSYSIMFWKWRPFGRIVLIKQNGKWKIDGVRSNSLGRTPWQRKRWQWVPPGLVILSGIICLANVDLNEEYRTGWLILLPIVGLMFLYFLREHLKADKKADERENV